MEAVKWTRKAADQGHERAQCNIGTFYYHGTGLEKDALRAYAWLNLASMKLPEVAAPRDQLEKELTPAQLSATKKLTVELRAEIESKQKAKE